MNDNTVETIETAETWIDLSNQKNLEELSNITSPDLELIGPKGTGVITHQDLGEWIERANLQLATIERYAKDHYTVFVQHGTWLNDDNTIKGQDIVFTVFKVVDQHVNFLARYDNKEDAFKISGLGMGDKIN
ncbi:hypothetical protein [Virgibacillus siamensis]|uniref:hypothetical protein n=1 Tax=Virgibacillus siamensis TaxID=480071 RepID=UPI0009852968|nr:hypothetical protein [Virgibacillus siamensis]